MNRSRDGRRGKSAPAARGASADDLVELVCFAVFAAAGCERSAVSGGEDRLGGPPRLPRGRESVGVETI